MRTIIYLITFVALAMAMAVGIAELAGLSLNMSLGLSAFASLLIYLMLDPQPETNAGDATIVRLTKGSWRRRR